MLVRFLDKTLVNSHDFCVCVTITTYSLFKNKRFVLNEMFQQNASKFAIHKGKSKVARNEKLKKLKGFSYT